MLFQELFFLSPNLNGNLLMGSGEGTGHLTAPLAQVRAIEPCIGLNWLYFCAGCEVPGIWLSGYTEC